MVARPVCIKGGTLVQPDAPRPERIDILVQEGRIAAVGRDLAAPPETEIVDASEFIVHPGLINAHVHSHGGLAKGMGDLWTLELLLNGGPAMNGGRSVEDKALSATLSAAEMLLKGCTACYDLMVEFPAPSREGVEAVADAYAAVGMRAVLAPMVADRSFFQAIPGLRDQVPQELLGAVDSQQLAPAGDTLGILKSLLQTWTRDRRNVILGVAPTIPHHCSDEFMVRAARLAREHGAGLHMHLSESKVQAVIGMELYGKTAAAHLADLGILGPDFTAAHGVWLDRDDMKLLADHGSSVAHNPASNMRLGNGIANSRAILDTGVNLGLGTDGSQCSDSLNMYEAMRLASLSSKARGPNTGHWLTTVEAARAATTGSARALGLDGKIGKIEAGYRADLVMLRLTSPNWMPLNNAINQLVHIEDGTAVSDVMVDGEWVVRQGRLTRLDLTKLRRHVEDTRARLADINAERSDNCERLAVIVNRFCPCIASRPYHIDRFAATAVEQ
mgnify:CR=1 FL=1